MHAVSWSRPFAFLVSLLLAYATLLAIPPAEAATYEPRAAAGKKPRLTATKPKRVAAGTKARSKVTLKNTTTKNLKNVKITTLVSGTATVTPRVKKIKNVRKGRKATFRLKFVTGNERAVKVTVIAEVKGKKAATTRVTLKTKPGTSTPATSLVGRYFFHKGINTPSDKDLYFSDGLANQDVPDEAYVPCSAPSDECQPFTYDAKSGSLTVGSEQGQVSGVGLTLGADVYQEAALQQAGTRYAVTLSASTLSDSCPLLCWGADYDLTLGADGSYSEAWQNINGNSGIHTGTYEVIPGSRLRLLYVDGDGVSRDEIKTIGVVLDEAGNPSPVVDGLVLAGNWYSPDN